MAAISFQRINKAAIAQRRTQKKLVTITTIFYGLAMLLFCLDSEGIGAGMGVMLGFCGFITGFISFNATFKDLHNRQQADVTLSMPMTGVERFISKILCCFYVQIIPAMICAIVSGNVGFFVLSNGKTDYYAELWITILMIFAAELFELALVSLCSACCGTHGESIFFTVLLGTFQAAIPPAFITMIIETPSGVDFLESHNMKWNLWGYGLIQAVEETDVNSNLGMLCLVILVNILISVVILFVAGRIYSKRDARVVGTPVANKPFFEMMMFFGVILVYLVFFFTEMAGWGILIAAIAYVVINIVVSRKNISAAGFLLWTGKLAVITVIFLAVASASIATGGFGYINTEPDTSLSNSDMSVNLFVPEEVENDKNAGTYVSFKGYDLSDKQCREVMDIFRRYMKENKRGIFDILVDNGETEQCTLRLSKRYPEISRNEIILQDKIPGCTYEYDTWRAIGYMNDEPVDTTLEFKQGFDLCVKKAKNPQGLYEDLKKLDYLKLDKRG